jgi:hypothetical protein
VVPEALAASISRFSRSETDAMTNSLRSGESQPDPIELIGSARGARTSGAGRFRIKRPRSRTVGLDDPGSPKGRSPSGRRRQDDRLDTVGEELLRAFALAGL